MYLAYFLGFLSGAMLVGIRLIFIEMNYNRKLMQLAQEDSL